MRSLLHSDNIWFGIKTALIVITAKNFLENRIKPVNGFTTVIPSHTTRTTSATTGLIPLQRQQQQHQLKHQPYPSFVVLHGLLDDMMLDDDGADDDSSSSTTNAAFDDLFSALIFSSNPKNAVESRIDECTNEEFLSFLSTSIESSSDEEEKQAYQDLLSMINDVKTELQQKEEQAQIQKAKLDKELQLQAKQEEEEMSKLKQEAKKNLSAADMLQRANDIDNAVMVSAKATEDEIKPNDFMRDVKLERGLSGFNNSGKMRVGGR